MPFHEKSAWIMTFALLLAGAFYVWTVSTISAELGQLAPPVLPVVVVYTVIITIVATVGHILIAVFSPRDAREATDEREKRIVERMGHVSGYVLGVGIILALGTYLFTYDGNLMFYIVFGSLMLSQLAEYVGQIVLYRVGVY